MVMAGNDTNVEPSKESENAVNFSSPNVSTEWLINGSNITSGVVTMDSSMVEVSSVPSTITVGSFCPPPIWDQPINGQSLGYCNMNVQNDPSTSSSLRADMGWISNAMIRDGMFRPPVSRMLPHSSLPPFPSDSSFIERAARFSCFNGGSFSAMVHPLGIPEPFGPIQGPVESEKKRELDEADGVNVSINQCDEGEISGHGVQEELANTGEESTGKRHVLTKRKRVEQRGENKEGDGDTSMKKGDENPSSTSNHGGKQGKQDSQGSDPPKDDYIHVRARRGQATNSHSLAERIRREKVSERMKLLQDLVPGCSKVTGKAVMLDEIINYVQSLQRQVEFLSMKLATVNPQLNFNMEGFLVKDIVQSRACLSSSNMAFPPDSAMPFPPLHTLHAGLNQAGLHGMRNPSGALQRSMELDSTVICGGLCEPSSQVKDAPGVWDDELHNVVHNGFNSSGPLDHTPDASDHMKAEP